jgi:hypothetical protein
VGFWLSAEWPLPSWFSSFWVLGPRRSLRLWSLPHPSRSPLRRRQHKCSPCLRPRLSLPRLSRRLFRRLLSRRKRRPRRPPRRLRSSLRAARSRSHGYTGGRHAGRRMRRLPSPLPPLPRWLRQRPQPPPSPPQLPSQPSRRKKARATPIRSTRVVWSVPASHACKPRMICGV